MWRPYSYSVQFKVAIGDEQIVPRVEMEYAVPIHRMMNAIILSFNESRVYIHGVQV